MSFVKKEYTVYVIFLLWVQTWIHKQNTHAQVNIIKCFAATVLCGLVSPAAYGG